MLQIHFDANVDGMKAILLYEERKIIQKLEAEIIIMIISIKRIQLKKIL